VRPPNEPSFEVLAALSGDTGTVVSAEIINAGLRLRGFTRSGYFGAAIRRRNSFRDSCDVAVETSADLAKIKKGQVTLAAFDPSKITSV